MKRAKRLTKKPDPAEESSNGSSADELTQPAKKGKGKKTVKSPEPPDGSDSDEVPTPATRQEKAKGKKAKPTKSEDLDTQKKAKQTSKNEKGKGKKPMKVAESSYNSDLDEASSKTTTKAKPKGKNRKVSKPVEDSSHNSDSGARATQTKKKGNTKKALNTESKGESSNNSGKNKEEPEETADEVSEDEQSGDISDADDTSSKSKKKAKEAKVLMKFEPKDEPSDDAGNNNEEPEEVEDDIEDDVSEDEQSDEVAYGSKLYNKSLRKLDNMDPEFFTFLKDYDNELLKLGVDEDPLEEKEGDSDYEEKVHVPGDLHGDSDESDFEAEDAKSINGKVTLKMVKEWQAEMQKDGKVKLGTLIHVVKLFNAAVLRATSEDGTTAGEYNVAGSSVFNAVINMCVLYLPNAIKKYLGMEKSDKDPKKCKHFVKIKGTLVQYLTDILKLLSVVTSDNILIIVLKHFHQMSRFVACFTRIAKKAIKRLLTLWSTGDETVRVLAFICILRITRNQQRVLLDPVLKAMYMTYVKNCKFVSPTTWPGINFMRRSLIEIYMLDLNTSYNHVFLYLRQLGIHLRNAITYPKKDHKHAVCNWQYLNSLHLWANLIQQTTHHTSMESLFYPVATMISNTIRFVPAVQYYPLRFYLTEILMDLTTETGIFMPVLGFLVDVLNKFDFNKRLQKVSMKPLDFSCIIRLSKSQMNETGFQDAVVDRWYALLLEYTTSISHTYAFPEVCTIIIVHLGSKIDKCTNPSIKKKLEQIHDKIEENSNYISNMRLICKIKNLREVDVLLAWQAKVKSEGTPLLTYYGKWSKLNNIQKRKIISKNDVLYGNIPVVIRPKISEEAKTYFSDSVTPIKLFPSDSEDEVKLFESDDGNKASPKDKKSKKKVLRKKKNINQDNGDDKIDFADAEDIVHEFSDSDW